MLQVLRHALTPMVFPLASLIYFRTPTGLPQAQFPGGFARGSGEEAEPLSA